MFDKFGEVFNDKLQDSTRFRDNLQDIIYRVLEPSIKIEDIEVYINVQYWMNKIDGMKVFVDGFNAGYDFTPEMFIEIS
jgi:hypothetical protein